uniref:Uncharacterized protein n=1 Tax=Anguilla anguilla TaxID=7936 RepID=A0A0E9SZ00_ANGAN
MCTRWRVLLTCVRRR